MEKFKLKVLFVLVLIVLDTVSTVWLMNLGFGEANPILAWVAENWSISGMAFAKIIWSLFLIAFLMQWQEFRKYVDYLIIGYIALYVGGTLIQFV